MDDLITGSLDLNSWQTWIQDVGKKVISTKTEAQYNGQLELDKMKLAQRGPYGDPYYEGQPTAVPGVMPATVLGVPVLWLLVGAGLYFAMKD